MFNSCLIIQFQALQKKGNDMKTYLVLDITKLEQEETKNAIVFHSTDRYEALSYAEGQEEYAVFEQTTNYED